MLSWFMRLLMLVVVLQLAAATMCPDNRMECREKNTCCAMPGGKAYGCCPFASAICCIDHIHCCPHGKTCDEARGSCTSNGVAYINPLMMMLARIFPTLSGDSPMMPITAGVVRSEQQKVKLLKKAALLSSDANAYTVVEDALTNGTVLVMGPCPDRSVCPDKFTCCPFADGSYGCCPFNQGVCCSDHLSCCPHATTCQPDHTCARN